MKIKALERNWDLSLEIEVNHPNYIYGSAKAGFTTFLSGLRNRLAKKHVHVLMFYPTCLY